MKKINYLLTLLLLLTSAGCSASDDNNEPPAIKGKILVAYFSYSGNTRQVAEDIKNLTEADIFEIIPVEPYPEDYDEVVAQARRERESGYKPPLKAKVANLVEYDVVFVGFPIWGTTIPNTILTFLTENNMAGKTVIPFCTHAGYGKGRSFTAVQELCPGATFAEGFDMEGDDVKDAEPQLRKWLEEIKVINP